MERRTAPPPADGRPRQLGNGGFNKALMPAQVASLSPYNNMEGEKRKGAERQDTHVAPVLAQRAPSEGPRWTRAVGTTWVPASNTGEEEVGEEKRRGQVPSLLAERARAGLSGWLVFLVYLVLSDEFPVRGGEKGVRNHCLN
jgi:hypothetical protein